MKLLIENWRQYIEEGYLDDYAGFTSRRTRAALTGPLKDNDAAFRQAKETLERILTVYAHIDEEGNISTDPREIADNYGKGIERFLPEEWAKGNISDPELKSFRGESWRKLGDFNLREWHLYKNNRLKVLSRLRRYLKE